MCSLYSLNLIKTSTEITHLNLRVNNWHNLERVLESSEGTVLAMLPQNRGSKCSPCNVIWHNDGFSLMACATTYHYHYQITRLLIKLRTFNVVSNFPTVLAKYYTCTVHDWESWCVSLHQICRHNMHQIASVPASLPALLTCIAEYACIPFQWMFKEKHTVSFIWSVEPSW